MSDCPAEAPVPDFLATGCMIFSTNPLPQVSAFPEFSREGPFEVWTSLEFRETQSIVCGGCLAGKWQVGPGGQIVDLSASNWRRVTGRAG